MSGTAMRASLALLLFGLLLAQKVVAGRRELYWPVYYDLLDPMTGRSIYFNSGRARGAREWNGNGESQGNLRSPRDAFRAVGPSLPEQEEERKKKEEDIFVQGNTLDAKLNNLTTPHVSFLSPTSITTRSLSPFFVQRSLTPTPPTSATADIPNSAGFIVIEDGHKNNNNNDNDYYYYYKNNDQLRLGLSELVAKQVYASEPAYKRRKKHPYYHGR